MTTQDAIDKYFKNERVLYFHSSDALSQIEGDTYLRYQKTGNIELWYGGDNGEMCLCVTLDGDKLERIITALIQN